MSLAPLDDDRFSESLRPVRPDEAREALAYWRARRRRLPVYRVAHRREARRMIERWEQRLYAAELERWGGHAAGRAIAALSVLRGLPLANALPRLVRTIVPRGVRRAAVICAGLFALGMAFALASLIEQL
jgi:hypothetical protein